LTYVHGFHGNGDGLDDLIVGAWDSETWAGESYVVFGKAVGLFESAIVLRLIALLLALPNTT
jgi:hypothetical protein